MAQQSGDYDQLTNQISLGNVGQLSQMVQGRYPNIGYQALGSNTFYCTTCCCWQWGFHNGTVFVDPSRIPTNGGELLPARKKDKPALGPGSTWEDGLKNAQKPALEKRRGFSALVEKTNDERKAERLERLAELGIGCITEYDGNNGTPASCNFLAVKMDARDRIQRSF